MGKSKKPKISFKRKLQLLPILAILLCAGVIFAVGSIVTSIGTVVAILETETTQQEEKEKAQEIESSKLQTSPEIVAMRPMFINAIEEAIEDAGCLDLEDQKDAVVAWMMAICAASTKNWTVNTQRNIMGVPGFPADETSEKSVEMAAELIVSLYKEMTGQTGDGTFSVPDFKRNFGLDEEDFAGIERLKYSFDGGFKFGYPSGTNSYASGETEDDENEEYSIQKMCLFTACYFLGDTSLAKWAALSLNSGVEAEYDTTLGYLAQGAETANSYMAGGGATQSVYEDLPERRYWNRYLLESYEALLENAAQKGAGSATAAAQSLSDTSSIIDTLIEQGTDIPITPQEATTDYFQNALFIGDSRIVGLSMYHGGLLDGAKFFAKTGSSSNGLATADVEVDGKIEHLGTYLETHDFKKVYIMSGINSISYPAEYNAELLKEYLVDLILEKAPDAKIYIMSNISVTKAKGEREPVFSKEKINAYNKELEKLANGDNIVFLDVAAQFMDSEGWLDASVADSGGVHLVASANKTFAEFLTRNTYGSSKLITINYDLISEVYSYYNAYNKSIMTSGKFQLPFSTDYISLVTRPADVDDKFGFGRDAISDSNGNSSTGGAIPHKGYDIPLGYGTPLYACCDGYISEAEFGTPEGGFPTTAGRYITITSSDGAYAFDYFHLSAIAEGIYYGAEVKKGDLVAYSGNTSAGFSVWGSHFHFGVIDCSDYKYIDPLIILSNGQYFSTNIGGINDTSLFEERWDVKIIDEMPDWFAGPVYDADTVRWLSAIIWGEAGNQPFEGKVAVGIVVMNRFEQWKDNYGYETVYDVITQGNGVQFNPAMPGHSFWTALDSYDEGTLDNECIEAAILAANGQKIIYYDGMTYDFSDIMYFANVGYKDRPGVINIGDHGFANYIYWHD